MDDYQNQQIETQRETDRGESRREMSEVRCRGDESQRREERSGLRVNGGGGDEVVATATQVSGPVRQGVVEIWLRDVVKPGVGESWRERRCERVRGVWLGRSGKEDLMSGVGRGEGEDPIE